MTIAKIIATELYRFCNEKKLFTCGSTAQYDKMFELARDGVTKSELAVMLYICSDSEYTLAAITKMITPLFRGAE